MKLRLLGVAIAVAVGVMNIGLAPAAGGNPGNPSSPAQEKTPPGQAAKDEGKPEKSIPPGQLDKPDRGTTEPAPSASEPAVTEHVQAASSEEASSSDPKPKHAAKSSVTKDADPKPDHPAKQEVGKPASSPHAKSQSAHGNSAVAHTHVIICHRTGSRSNPYVVINISMSAWLHGHATHPARNGHNDILLKQGTAPGEKMPRSACGDPGTSDSPTPPVVDPIPTPTPTDTARTPSGPPTGKPADPSAPAGPLLPPVLPKGKPGHEDEGVAARVEAGVLQELPFTGLPLWMAVFAGCLLLGTGLAIRKASWAPSKAEVDLRPPSRRT
jgi:hypothetical protein